MALTAPRNTTERNGGRRHAFAIAAAVTIYPGSLVAVNAAGDLVPGSTATTLTAVGRAETGGTALVDGTATAVQGTFKWKNSAAGDLITKADWGKAVYIVDDETVAKTNGTTTRSVAGICRGVDADGVWVET